MNHLFINCTGREVAPRESKCFACRKSLDFELESPEMLSGSRDQARSSPETLENYCQPK